jgi:hypothetical protein
VIDLIASGALMAVAVTVSLALPYFTMTSGGGPGLQAGEESGARQRRAEFLQQ